MRVKKEPKPIQKTCIDCNEIFIAYGHKAMRCPECRKIKQRQQSKKSMEYLRQYKKPQGKKKKIIKPAMTMRETIAAMERYNKEHNTHLTYGKFIALMEGGKLDG